MASDSTLIDGMGVSMVPLDYVVNVRKGYPWGVWPKVMQPAKSWSREGRK